jgi:SNF family Na+-dependent transporter
MFSFISGFAVFAALGHLSFLSGTSVTDLPFAGFSLVFGTWPVVLGSLSGGEHWVRLLFFNLFLLGINSAFGFTKGVVTVLLDTTFLQHLPKWKVTAAVCLVGWLLSLVYATDAGLNFLDVIDFYINFVMLFVGFCHDIHHCTPWDKTLLETESGKTCGRYYEQPAIHLSGLRDCKTLLAGDTPLGLGSGYKDLCNKGSTDQRTQKTMIED